MWYLDLSLNRSGLNTPTPISRRHRDIRCSERDPAPFSLLIHNRINADTGLSVHQSVSPSVILSVVQSAENRVALLFSFTRTGHHSHKKNLDTKKPGIC